MGATYAWLGAGSSIRGAGAHLLRAGRQHRDQQLLQCEGHLGRGWGETWISKCPKVDYDKPASYGSLELRKSTKNEDIGQTISYDKSDTYEVPMITLDSVKLSQVDFIKIDVEGMEIDVLRGAAKLLKKHCPMMLMEHIKTDKKALIDMLTSFGYKHYILGINILAVHESDKIEITL